MVHQKSKSCEALLQKRIAIKGQCLIGLLILIHCDQYEDFISVLSHQSGYIHFVGEHYVYRTFPWSLSFNVNEGAQLQSIKQLKFDLRPSTARVKVELNLLDKHPKRIKLQYLDEETIRFWNTFRRLFMIIFLYVVNCNCKNQGHAETNCHLS
ncbi:hypothetical protein H5410_006108 [Solanum commersonii]|uniref:Uncharacterized protein n=1 Tax=Solanum commersonii TaxID=4109 RepID=A0A9J6A9F4_SOLCO|nr:hypothetical protein H5410_006108 [Solanum commersonii]